VGAKGGGTRVGLRGQHERRLVGYCYSCRFFRVHDEEAETLHPQVRFGVCRLGVKAVPASCERYEPRRVRGGR
jgi:hypothetical protein